MSNFKKYQCIICDTIYDEAKGMKEGAVNIPPGTKWRDVSYNDFACPNCGVGKTDYEEVIE